MKFIDLAAQRSRLGSELIEAINAVIERDEFILGKDVEALESQLGERVNVRNAVTCASGTDAILLALMAAEIGPGDAVYVPSFTFVATAEPVRSVGATPVFVDVDPRTFLIDLDKLTRSLGEPPLGLRPRAIIAVDLFGQPCDYVALAEIAESRGLLVIADAAQSFGARDRDRPVGRLAPITTTSFFPSKPLGCYGDGGAVFTDDDRIADVMRSIRGHGMGRDKYDNVRIGVNSRLDTIQAAIIQVKLSIFDEELESRAQIAAGYSELLAGTDVLTPVVRDGATSTWALYTIQSEARDELARGLSEAGIPTAIYYRLPIHMQPAYREFPIGADGVQVSEGLSRRVLSLPMHPYLDDADRQTVAEAIRSAGQPSGLIEVN